MEEYGTKVLQCSICHEYKQPGDYSVFLVDSPFCICDDCVLEVYNFLKPICERLIHQRCVESLNNNILSNLKEGKNND